jgi:hypothetical protein
MRAFVLGIIESSQSGDHGQWRDEFLGARHAVANAIPHPGRLNLPQNVPMNDPKPDPMHDPITDALNKRQRWFLGRVGNGMRCRADDLAAYWAVSLKTARRDISGLCAAGQLQFVGARRNGRYQRMIQSA